VMSKHHPNRHGVGQRAAQIVVGIVIHQRTGVNPHPAVLFHDHLAEVAHERVSAVGCLILGHAVSADVGHARGVAARLVEIGEGHKIEVFRESHSAELRSKSRFYRGGVFVGLHMARDGNSETGLLQSRQGVQRQGKVSFTTAGIVKRRVGFVEADTEADGIGSVAQCQYLVPSFGHGLRSVGQDHAGPMRQTIVQDFEDVFVDEWLTACEGKLFHAEPHCLINKGSNFTGSHLLQAMFARPGTLQAKGAREVACGTGVKPQFPEQLGLNIPPRRTVWRLQPIGIVDMMAWGTQGVWHELDSLFYLANSRIHVGSDSH
jgi:hypothetical protein